MSNPLATWSMSLDVECPGCEGYVDLLRYADFWDGRNFEACEQGTDRSKNVEVVCPECNHEFKVDLEF